MVHPAGTDACSTMPRASARHCHAAITACTNEAVLCLATCCEQSACSVQTLPFVLSSRVAGWTPFGEVLPVAPWAPLAPPQRLA